MEMKCDCRYWMKYFLGALSQCLLLRLLPRTAHARLLTVDFTSTRAVGPEAAPQGSFTSDIP